VHTHDNTTRRSFACLGIGTIEWEHSSSFVVSYQQEFTPRTSTDQGESDDGSAVPTNYILHMLTQLKCDGCTDITYKCNMTILHG